MIKVTVKYRQCDEPGVRERSPDGRGFVRPGRKQAARPADIIAQTASSPGLARRDVKWSAVRGPERQNLPAGGQPTATPAGDESTLRPDDGQKAQNGLAPHIADWAVRSGHGHRSCVNAPHLPWSTKLVDGRY